MSENVKIVAMKGDRILFEHEAKQEPDGPSYHGFYGIKDDAEYQEVSAALRSAAERIPRLTLIREPDDPKAFVPPTMFSMDLASKRDQLAVLVRDFDSGQLQAHEFPLAEELGRISHELREMAGLAASHVGFYPRRRGF